jgi:acyltransferase
VAPLLVKFRLLSYLGRNAIIIFGLHLPIGNLVYNAFNKLIVIFIKPPIIVNEDVYVIVSATCTMVLIIPFLFLINNYFSFIIGKRRDS